MFYLFTQKNLLPGDYYRLPAGEKQVIRAFFEADIDLRLKERKRRR